MADISKQPTPIYAEELGVQLRFRHREPEAEDGVPPIALWRNNLTALSQHYNLYFIAYSEDIYVYKPSFPFQILPDDPKLIIQPTLAKNDGIGYINPDMPHLINQIAVANLGNEEILVCVRDDGNAAAYYTRPIQLAVEENNRSEEQLQMLDTKYLGKPFFSVCVNSSAWGISVHTEARMIAISCNDSTISVFAFALGKNGSFEWSHRSEHEDFYGFMTLDSSTPGVRGLFMERSKPLRMILRGHKTNIPSISFCNSLYHDPKGTFLASLDIDSNLFLWNIWSQTTPSTINVVHCYYSNDDNPGWTVICPDILSFRKVKNFSKAVGLEATQVKKVTDTLLDVSGRRFQIPNSSSRFAGYDITEIASNSLTSASEFINPLSFMIDMPDSPDFPDSPGIVLEQKEEDDFDFSRWDFQNHQGPSTSFHPVDMPISNPPIFCSLKFDLILMDQNHRPHIVFRRLVKQDLPSNLQNITQMDRLNMSAYIPELGLVAIATQLGRVALLSLTATPQGQLAFKVEHILPFDSQEKAKKRPEVALLGLAVGPIQGRGVGRNEDGVLDGEEAWRKIEGERRYRLLLTYYDHSVLSYEIGRKKQGKIDIFLF
ncbi:MAG: hypothetical protein M1834_000433 [Cirrosporium novae-zelandiae]|nr:MAG: hypothetical protein M1834_000433 [Cirrosporium novae-zelandiae]